MIFKRIQILSLLAAFTLGLIASGAVFYYMLESKLGRQQPLPQISSVSYQTAPRSSALLFEPTGAFQKAAGKSVPAVVYITTQKKTTGFWGSEEGNAAGSGVVVAPEGFIVTNAHVVEDANKITVTLTDRSEHPATLIATDPNTDLAVVKIDTETLEKDQLRVMAFANSDEVQIGQWVLAVGNPFSLTSTVTAGIVSAKARGNELHPGRRRSALSVEAYIQTDAAVNPGNSGGALVNLTGDLVGINTVIATSSGVYEGYSFAIPSNLVRKVVNDLIQHQAVQRAFIGISIGDITRETYTQYDLRTRRGVLVQNLAQNGAAQTAGLAPGDVILGIEGRRVAGTSELQEYIATRRPGDRVQLQVLRKTDTLRFALTLRNLQGTTGIVAADYQASESSNSSATPDNKRDARGLADQLGGTYAALTAKEKGVLGIRQGIKITGVTADGALAAAGIPPGSVITRANRTDIDSPDALLEALATVQIHAQLEGITPEGKRQRYLVTLK